MATEILSGGNVEPRALEDEMRSAYLDYAMSVIVGRALPDVRDGLKPVHRRVLFGMSELGLGPTRSYAKCARIVGEVMGNYHPHGDSAIYDALVRLAQDFSMRYPLVDGQGNFGSVDDDPAAAMRYCVTGDTRVATQDGTRRIESIVPGGGPGSDADIELKVLDRRGNPVSASRLFDSGDHPTLRLRTAEGFELTGTRNHPVLCLVDMGGVPLLMWKLLEELKPGDTTVIARVPRPDTRPLSETDRHVALLLGGFVSEFVPERVWRSNTTFKRAFLQALFTGDGSASLLPRSSIQVSYSTYSEQLARDVQLLLLEFGVVARICRYSEGERKLVISNRRDARLFSARVGFLGAKQCKLEQILAQLPQQSRSLSRDHVPYVADFIRSAPGQYADRDWLRRHNVDRIERWEQGGTAILERLDPDHREVVEPLVDGDYFYAKVASVEDAGVQRVYSLRVDTTDHSFLTNGFVSHNTEARLDRVATEMLRDLDMDTVDFVPNYDGRKQEPTVLPARFPNLLVNGSSGIAVGMATNIPPHNLREVIAATIAYIDNPATSGDELAKIVKGPDFPTGGIILGRAGILAAYETGRGRVRVQAKAHIEPLSHGKEAIIVTELPYMVKKGGDGGLIQKIAALVHEKKISEISDLRDESDKRGMRLVIELKRDVLPKVVLNKLYKHTAMQTTFGVNMVALVDGVPKTLSLQQVIHHYVVHQREVIVRRTKFELAQREARAHILEGLLIALEHLDAVIVLIRSSPNRESAREQLIAQFDLSPIQAQAILDLRLSQLTALESDQIRKEHADTMERIGELRAILGDELVVLSIIKDELTEIVNRFGDERRTEISPSDGDIDIEDLIADQQMVIAITRSGYIKSLPLVTYRQQHRGGRGVTGMDMKDGDFIEHLFISSTHDYLLFFTNRGKVYRSKVYELPEASRTAKGRALVNILPLREGERVQSVLATRDYNEGAFLVFATKHGIIKKTAFGAYNTPINADGIIAINIRPDDELVAVRRTSGDDDILMVSRSGRAARFHESAVRPMGRDTSGMKGMNVSHKGNHLLAMDVARDDQELLVVTENGYGKRTVLADYPRKGRDTMGVKTIALTESKGALAGALVVREHEDLVFISHTGMVQRTSVRGINRYGRGSQGVRVMNLKDDDTVSAIALVAESSEEIDADGPLPDAPEPVPTDE